MTKSEELIMAVVDIRNSSWEMGACEDQKSKKFTRANRLFEKSMRKVEKIADSIPELQQQRDKAIELLKTVDSGIEMTTEESMKFDSGVVKLISECEGERYETSVL